MSKYFITGGSGFIGTNLIDFLIKNNEEIYNVDIKEPKKAEHDLFFHRCDKCDYLNRRIYEEYGPYSTNL